MISSFYSQQYYSQRADFLRDVAQGKINHISEVRVKFSRPEAGWIDMDVYADGIKAISIRLSDVFDPIPEMRKWLLNIISGRYTTCQFDIDEEGCLSIFTFEAYGVELSTPDDFNNRIQLGLFTIYETEVESMPVKILVETRQLVSAMYLGLLSYAATFHYRDDKDSFTCNWHFSDSWDEAEDADSEMDCSKGQWNFYNTVKSPELEWFLYSDFPWHSNEIDFTKYKPEVSDYICMWAEWGDGLFWTTGGCCGNADAVYANGQKIDLSDIIGLRDWYDEFDNGYFPEDPWENDRFRDWLKRGRAFAIEIRKRLPKSVELFYYWMSFKHQVEELPDVMDLIPLIPIKKYKPL